MTTESYVQERWSLDDMFASIDSDELKEALAALEKQVEYFEGHRQELTDDISSDRFFEILEAYDGLVRLQSRLGGFASLRFSEDTQDQRVQAFQATIQQRQAAIENRIMFFKLWWKQADQQVAERLLPAAGDYRYWLEAMRLQTPHTLTEPEERVVNLKDVNGVQGLVTIYAAITNRYTFELEVEGEVRHLTRGEIMSYVRSSDPDLRARAYQSQLEVFGKDASILGQFYQYIARDWYTEGVDMRGYQAPISVRNLANDIPDEVVDMLLETCRGNATLFQRFFKLKARWLGAERIRRYDVYAPVSKGLADYGFNDAVDIVLESFAGFDPRMADLARKVFEERHLDSEVRPGKRSGAFCATVEPNLTPWVLTNYQGKADDALTLAHELGHAVHSLLADEHKAVTQGASLPLAETASTFGEILVLNRMLRQDPSEAVRRDLLFRQLDDNYATIMRQAFFAMFERAAHDAIHEGASVDDLSGLYADNLHDQFGDSLELTEDFNTEWVSIPHFYYSPFYVYAYAFGQLLVLSLYRQFEEEGDAFKPRYLEILRAGGSASPDAILTKAGIDMRDRSFWQGGFNVLDGILAQLEQMKVPART